jgi:hypothetical protein
MLNSNFSQQCFLVSLLAVVLCLSGCATFMSHDLPDYTFADLPPAPKEKKVCLVVDFKDCDEKCHEWNDPVYEMFERSGYFLMASGHCTPNSDLKDRFYMTTQVKVKHDNWPVAFISGFICGATFGIIPGYEKDSVTTSIQIKKQGQMIKEYVYREYSESWIHLAMLFKMSDHAPRKAMHELQNRVYMNFLHDFSHDFNNDLFASEAVP